MSTFDDFFEKATGVRPYGYQQRLAANGLPRVVQAPTGTGKTAAVVLAWLWRRLHGDPGGTPRRLIFALPQRTLVEQTSAQAHSWLERLGLTDDVALHVVMGGEGRTQGRWRMELDKPAIVVGTVDSLVSKALNRGYGIGRGIYPVDFALVTNDAQWVIDEIQLCPESTTTLWQLAGFADPSRAISWPTAGPFAVTCMSATVPKAPLDTVDSPPPTDAEIVRIEQADRVGSLARRLDASRTVRQLPAEPGQHRQIAAVVRKRHRPGTLTLVVVNTIKMARALYAELRGDQTPCTLIHSRFRALERETLVQRLIAEPGEHGHIVVSTQVVEAGVDVNAAVLVTEAAPWPSVVQRAGRCNRTGEVENAELWWLPPAKPEPYEKEDVDATVAELTAMEGHVTTSEGMLARTVATIEPQVSVIRRPDLLALFDTAPDLGGADVDIAPYVRDADDLDVQVAWAHWTRTDDGGKPPAGAKPPEARLRCRVPLAELRTLARAKSVWRHDQRIGEWTRVTDNAPARPGEVLLMAARDGCYSTEMGFDPTAAAEVPDSPDISTRPDRTTGTDATAGAEDAYRQDDTSIAQRAWIPLWQHSEDTRAQAEELLRAVGASLPESVRQAVQRAAYLHDVGKCHETWQDALCALATDDERDFVNANRPWAKSRAEGQLSFAGGVSFRHELASLLLLDGPLRPLLDGVEEADLVRYLVLAHHGKLRVQVRGLDDTDDKVLLGLRDGDSVAVPGLFGQPAGELTVDIGQFSLGGERSWTRTALRLRDRFGPFVLAYLETLVRMADWRASEHPTVPGDTREGR